MKPGRFGVITCGAAVLASGSVAPLASAQLTQLQRTSLDVDASASLEIDVLSGFTRPTTNFLEASSIDRTYTLEGSECIFAAGGYASTQTASSVRGGLTTEVQLGSTSTADIAGNSGMDRGGYVFRDDSTGALVLVCQGLSQAGSGYTADVDVQLDSTWSVSSSVSMQDVYDNDGLQMCGVSVCLDTANSDVVISNADFDAVVNSPRFFYFVHSEVGVGTSSATFRTLVLEFDPRLISGATIRTRERNAKLYANGTLGTLNVETTTDFGVTVTASGTVNAGEQFVNEVGSAGLYLHEADVNGDGVLNTSDVTALTNQIAGGTVAAFRESALDIDNDGVLDQDDVDKFAAFVGALATTPVATSTCGSCPTDLNSDGLVNAADLLLVTGNLGTTVATCSDKGDVNGDGLVDSADLLAVLGAFGLACEPLF